MVSAGAVVYESVPITFPCASYAITPSSGDTVPWTNAHAARSLRPRLAGKGTIVAGNRLPASFTISRRSTPGCTVPYATENGVTPPSMPMSAGDDDGLPVSTPVAPW